MNVDSCKCCDGFSLEKSPRICSCPGLILTFDFFKSQLNSLVKIGQTPLSTGKRLKGKRMNETKTLGEFCDQFCVSQKILSQGVKFCIIVKPSFETKTPIESLRDQKNMCAL